MIVPSDNYKINKKTGDIVKRQIVKIKCDDCGDIWESLYQTRKTRQLDKDYCRKCRYALNNNLKYSGIIEKKKTACLNCKSIFHKKNGRDTKCCSLKCRDEYSLKQKYRDPVATQNILIKVSFQNSHAKGGQAGMTD